MDLHGKNLVGGELSADGTAIFNAVNPVTGETLRPVFYEATQAEITQALAIAEQAFQTYGQQPPEQVARFLDRIADEIVGLGQELLRRAQAETALPEARLATERARTTAQLKMFAE